MTAEITAPARTGDLWGIDDTLRDLWNRLREIADEPAPTGADVHDVVQIFGEVAHLFVYLEGNQRHVDSTPLLEWRRVFQENAELDEALLARFEPLRLPDVEPERQRQVLVAWLRSQAREPVRTAAAVFGELQARARAVRQEIQADQSRLLERLGVRADGGDPDVLFYRLVSGTENGATRSKILETRRRWRERRLTELVSVVDEIVELRRNRSREEGHPTVIAETMRKCGISESAAAAFVDAYLVAALAAHRELAGRIRAATGCTDDPMGHFGYFVRSLVDGTPLPEFDLDSCLEFLFRVAEKVLGVTVARVRADESDVIRTVVRTGGREVGTISFDLLAPGSPRNGPAGRSGRPEGHVLCRFRCAARGERLVTFESAHSVFHEFGHALGHVLLRHRTPDRSGMAYLPLERLEDLSMWFEKWVYHPEFGEVLNLPERDRAGLELCRRVKVLEFLSTDLERAVVAALDFDVHGRTTGGLADAFTRLDAKYDLARDCPFGTLPAYFTWPMFRENPGAGLVYLWGAADSTRKFAPFLGRRLADLNEARELSKPFIPCFDRNAPSVASDVRSVYSFYDIDAAGKLRTP